MTAGYEQLKEKIPEIIELAEKAPEEIRATLCQALIEELRTAQTLAGTIESPGTKSTMASDHDGGVSTNASRDKELPGIAVIDDEGNIRLTVRNLGGKSNAENAHRLVYMTIRAWEMLTGEDGIQRDQVNRILKTWRLYDGNSRQMIARDKGIQRDSGILRLDTPGKSDADAYLQQILEPA